MSKRDIDGEACMDDSLIDAWLLLSTRPPLTHLMMVVVTQSGALDDHVGKYFRQMFIKGVCGRVVKGSAIYLLQVLFEGPAEHQFNKTARAAMSSEVRILSHPLFFVPNGVSTKTCFMFVVVILTLRWVARDIDVFILFDSPRFKDAYAYTRLNKFQYEREMSYESDKYDKYDYVFKLLLIGDSGVGCVLVS
jgi:hypothetical protein